MGNNAGMSAFTWDVQGVTASGCAIIYKQYSKIQVLSYDSASHDVAITKELLKVHPKSVVVMDVAGVKLTSALFKFVRACVQEGMPESTHTYVVSCPRWANVVYSLALRLAAARDRPLAVLRTGSYSDTLDEIQSI